MRKTTATAKRTTRATQVREALAVFRERHRMTYEDLHLAMWNAGCEISERTLKRVILGTSAVAPHATTLAAIQAFLKNAGAAAAIKSRAAQVKVVRIKPRRVAKR